MFWIDIQRLFWTALAPLAKWSCQKRHIFSWSRRELAFTIRLAHQVWIFSRPSGSSTRTVARAPVGPTVISRSTARCWPMRA